MHAQAEDRDRQGVRQAIPTLYYCDGKTTLEKIRAYVPLERIVVLVRPSGRLNAAYTIASELIEDRAHWEGLGVDPSKLDDAISYLQGTK